MKIYLCGGINGLSDDEAKNWRDVCTEELEALGHQTIDPMRRDYRGVEDENVAEIINGDLSDIDESDIIFVNAARPSWGTAMEVFYAYQKRGKFIIVVHPPDCPVSPWLRGHSDLVVSSFQEAFDSLP